MGGLRCPGGLGEAQPLQVAGGVQRGGRPLRGDLRRRRAPVHGNEGVCRAQAQAQVCARTPPAQRLAQHPHLAAGALQVRVVREDQGGAARALAVGHRRQVVSHEEIPQGQHPLHTCGRRDGVGHDRVVTQQAGRRAGVQPRFPEAGPGSQFRGLLPEQGGEVVGQHPQLARLRGAAQRRGRVQRRRLVGPAGILAAQALDGRRVRRPGLPVRAQEGVQGEQAGARAGRPHVFQRRVEAVEAHPVGRITARVEGPQPPDERAVGR